MRTSRIVLALLMTTGLTTPSYPQEVPHFRLGLTGFSSVIGEDPTGTPGGNEDPDPTDPSEPDPDVNGDLVVRYDPLITVMNQPVTGTPIYDTNDITPTGYTLRDLSNSEEISVDAQSGELTWTPVRHSGRRSVEVGIFTTPDPDTMMDWPDLWTTVQLDVDPIHDIDLSPSTLVIRLGQTVQPIETLDLSASGYDPTTWSWWYQTNGPFYSNTTIDENGVSFDMTEARDSLDRGGNYYFQAVLQSEMDVEDYSDDLSVYSDSVNITVVGTPYFDWLTNTSSSTYRVFDNPNIPFDILYLKSGTPVSIGAPTGRNGATATVSSWPAWLDGAIQNVPIPPATPNQMPPGLSISTTGTITGTPASAMTEPTPVILPTISSDGRHGVTAIGIWVMDELPVTDPMNGGGPGGPTDPEPADADGDGVPDADDRHPLDPSKPGSGGTQCYDPEVYWADSDHMMCTYDPDFENENPRPAHVPNCADPYEYWIYRGADCVADTEFEQMYPGHIYGRQQIGPFYLVAKREHSMGNLGGNGAYCDHQLNPSEIDDFAEFEEAVQADTVQELREAYKSWSAAYWGNSGSYPDEALHAELCVYAQQYPSYDPENGSADFMIEWSTGYHRSQYIIDNLTPAALGGYQFP